VSKQPVADGAYPRLGGAKLSDRLAAELERRILLGQPGPGERLPTEAELCELFGVSRSVVRDALRTLGARGLVHVGPGQGIVVTAPSSEVFGTALLLLLVRSELTMREVTEARAAIETQLAPLAAANGAPDDWAQMEGHLQAFVAAVADQRWQVAHGEHLAFHLGILRAVHLPALEIFLNPMHEIILLSSLPVTADDFELWDVDTHPPILKALRAGDADRARQAVDDHFQAFLNDDRYSAFEATPFRDAGLEAMRRLAAGDGVA
jgi:DNA-binding FadR family transcriptional regulator